MYTEVEALAKMNSPFIIKYYGTVSRDDRLYIITEFADKGNIAHFLKSQKKGLDETLIWKIFLQCVMGLHHIHVKRILHRDIKTLNIFLDKDNNVKIGPWDLKTPARSGLCRTTGAGIFLKLWGLQRSGARRP
mmetsp:Transcript_38410/g.121384  ORF Transcript_38410/g.121384 Transcript_38410/m.121384 type:complete len:133 (+) Transcript_38410:509-907(+)